MIYDTIENMELYCREGDVLHKAISYAMAFDLSQPDGEYEVEGRDMFARVAGYETLPAEERTFESHKQYMDVQILRQGQERIDIALAEELEPLEPYDQATDMVMLKDPEYFSTVVCK